MSTKQTENHELTITVPETVKVTEKHRILNVEGPLGKTRKNFKKIPVDLQVNGKNITLRTVKVGWHHRTLLNLPAERSKESGMK